MQRLHRGLRKFAALPARDQILVATATGLVALMRVALIVIPFPRVKALVERGAPERSDFEPHEMDELRRIVWAVGATARRLLGDKPCLTQALVAQWLLARRGFATTLQVGVKKADDGALLAHAWLERDGEVIIGGADSPHRYVTLPPLR